MARRSDKRWTARRVLTRVAVLLVLGFIINVLVAWGFAAQFAYNPTAITPARSTAASSTESGWAGVASERYLYTFVSVHRVLGADEVTVRTRIDSADIPQRWPGFYRLTESRRREEVSLAQLLPVWAYLRLTPRARIEPPSLAISRWTAFGFPFRSVAMVSRDDQPREGALPLLGEPSTDPWSIIRIDRAYTPKPAPMPATPFFPSAVLERWPDQPGGWTEELVWSPNRTLYSKDGDTYTPPPPPIEDPPTIDIARELALRYIPNARYRRATNTNLVIDEYAARLAGVRTLAAWGQSTPGFTNNNPPGSVIIRLPTMPLIEGVILNAILYATLLAMLVYGIGFVRLVFRRRKGRCTKCGYDLLHNYTNGCPECGWNKPDAPTVAA